jgi:hypothetical protein
MATAGIDLDDCGWRAWEDTPRRTIQDPGEFIVRIAARITYIISAFLPIEKRTRMHIVTKNVANPANLLVTLVAYSALALSPIRAVAQMPMPASQPQPKPEASQQGQESQAPATPGKQQTWTGEITTSMCKVTGGSMAHDCILNCVKGGEKYVLIAKGQVREISNQDFSDLKEHAGHRVRLTGSLGPDGKTITVGKIEAVGK